MIICGCYFVDDEYDSMAATGENRGLQTQVLKCLSRWARFNFPPAELAASPLLPLTFQALALAQLAKPATDCISEFLRQSERMDQYPMLVQALVPRVLALRPNYGT